MVDSLLTVDVSPVLQHRADILSDGLQCTFCHGVDWELDGLREWPGRGPA